MASAAPVIIPLVDTSTSAKDGKEPLEKIIQRRSQEIIIGLCGAIGSGVKNLASTLEEQLISHNYQIERITISDLIKHHGEDLTFSGESDRYSKLQNRGDELRKKFSNNILAQYAIKQIALLRDSKFTRTDDTGSLLPTQTTKIAFVIDQLKHPSEIDLLREVYGSAFYQVGLLKTESERRRQLEKMGLNHSDISQLMERDKKSNDSHGQQVEKSLHRADYFIKNTGEKSQVVAAVSRFINLIHEVNHISPTLDETGMHEAYSASLRSACLSRQVGAVIMTEDGRIISSGCNDVPAFGGGLYNNSHTSDQRCYNHEDGICHNDKHKEDLRIEIESILTKRGVQDAKEISRSILNNTKAKSIIEYSRAVHAEMDAIVTLSRTPGESSVGKILYCTTFPCHICARHIVAAGIKKVVYIEPYEKSLALDLHSDAIVNGDKSDDINKTSFINFEGVSPRRYAKFFEYRQKRKDENGNVLSPKVRDVGHSDYRHMDSYVDYEAYIILSLERTTEQNS